MSNKDNIMKRLIKECDSQEWVYVDAYEIDYHRFIIDEIAPHLTEEGLKKLRDYYIERNKEGRKRM